MDPYAPPTALAPAGPASLGAWLKWLYGALAGMRAAATAVFYVGIEWPTPAHVFYANAVVRLLGVGCSVVALVWIHAASAT